MTQIEITASAVTAAPPAKLWELLCDTSRNPEWVEATAEFDPPRRQVHRSGDVPFASETLVIIDVAPSGGTAGL